jgi:hypothetical protein
VNGDMVNPKPIKPFEKDVSGINFFIDDKKQRLGQASWVVGSSPPRF